ncbi:hypothetical protein GQ44DRAFT_755433 [Phaeosphaeriaceae sp. PMI808]|nr:hypothetical protein GQ44DRAFT_755433 [Phaeosphaeriaceae sp. PMI808]
MAAVVDRELGSIGIIKSDPTAGPSKPRNRGKGKGKNRATTEEATIPGPNVVTLTTEHQTTFSQSHSQAGACSAAGNLHELSESLAVKLLNKRIEIGRRQELVSLYFERSPWVVVAMLAVMKAGAGILPVDPAHPSHRQKRMLSGRGESGLVLVSSRYVQRNFGGGWIVRAISEASEIEAVGMHTVELPTVDPQATCWVLFTSGITAYETLGALMSGACICISSNYDKLEKLPQFCTDFVIDTAILTPSMARLYKPDILPTMRTLVFLGEALSLQDISPWRHRSLSLFNGYDDPDLNLTRIGRLEYVPMWITTPGNYNKLAPIGLVGEIYIEGFTTARGYLNSRLTDAASINNPEWPLRGVPSRVGGRAEGEEFTRLDTLQGTLTTVNLSTRVGKTHKSEYEARELSLCLPAATEIVVETALVKRNASSTSLVAFMRMPVTQQFSSQEVAISPFELSDEDDRKTDRRKLRELAHIYAAQFSEKAFTKPQQLGGDSITALKIDGDAQQAGLELSVSNVFLSPILGELALCADRRIPSIAKATVVPRFLLLPKGTVIQCLVDEVADPQGPPAMHTICSHPSQDTNPEQAYNLHNSTTDVTTSNLLYAAWAIDSSWFTGNHNVTFRTVRSGRTVPVPYIENLPGPTIAKFPFGLSVDPSETISAFLRRVQVHVGAGIPFEHFGLQNISRLPSGCALACASQTLFVVQEKRAIKSNSLGRLLDTGSFHLETYALTLKCFLVPDGCEVKAWFDSRILEPWRSNS